MADATQWPFKIIDPLVFFIPKRTITRVFLHCTASDNKTLKGVTLVEEVNRWHQANGWSGVGYHEMIDKEGSVMSARPAERQGAAQLGKDQQGNVGAYAMCIHGNWEFTTASMEAVVVRCRVIDDAFKLAGLSVTFHGHREIDPKPCPVFDYGRLLGLDAGGHLFAIDGVEPEVIAKSATRTQ